MKMPIRFSKSITILSLAMVLAAIPTATVLASKDDHVAALELLRRGEILPLEHILEVVKGRVSGDVIEIELEREHDGWEYKVKMLTATGQVRKITLNARNGAVLKIKDD